MNDDPTKVWPDLFAGGDYIARRWLFWPAPLLGAALAGLLCRSLYESENIIDTIVVEERRVS